MMLPRLHICYIIMATVYSLIERTLNPFWLSCLGPLVYLLAKYFSNIWLSNICDFEDTWWRLFQKHISRTDIRYLRFYWNVLTIRFSTKFVLLIFFLIYLIFCFLKFQLSNTMIHDSSSFCRNNIRCLNSCSELSCSRTIPTLKIGPPFSEMQCT
jgi:hypothetical protein